MPPKQFENLKGYIDMVRNHREKAFDEGREDGIVSIIEYIKSGREDYELPENPYKIKENGKGKK